MRLLNQKKKRIRLVKGMIARIVTFKAKISQEKRKKMSKKKNKLMKKTK